MFGFKKTKFRSKQDVYNRVFLYSLFPLFILLCGIVGVERFRYFGFITDSQEKQSYYIVAAFGVCGFFYIWYKAFKAFSVIMNDEIDKLPDIPQTVVCLKCHEPFLGDNLTELKCPKCGGPVEDLRGFYDRHPELK